MDLALISAVELLSLADEEVVPCAAEMAQAFAARGESALPSIVGENYHAFAASKSRTELILLVASALVALSVGPRSPKLRQLPARTRVVPLDRSEIAAFRLGALRHAVFSLGMYDVPHMYDVIRLVETEGGKATGADVLAEVSYVASHPGDKGVTFVVSIRPWRGAGTEGSEEAFLRRRRVALDELEALLLRMVEVTPHSYADRLRAAALKALTRVRETTFAEDPIAAE